MSARLRPCSICMHTAPNICDRRAPQIRHRSPSFPALRPADTPHSTRRTQSKRRSSLAAPVPVPTPPRPRRRHCLRFRRRYHPPESCRSCPSQKRPGIWAQERWRKTAEDRLRDCHSAVRVSVTGGVGIGVGTPPLQHRHRARWLPEPFGDRRADAALPLLYCVQPVGRAEDLRRARDEGSGWRRRDD